MNLNIERARALLQKLQSSEAQSLLICVGQSNVPEFSENQRGIALLMYLLDAAKPVSNLLMFMSKSKLVFASDAALKFPAQLNDGFPIETQVIGTDCSFLAALCSEASPVWGPKKELSKDIQFGEFASNCLAALGSVSVTDGNTLIDDFLRQKDAKGLELMVKAGALAAATYKKFICPRIEEAVQQGAEVTPLTMLKFAQDIQLHLKNPTKLKGLEKLDDAAFFTDAFPPVVVRCPSDIDISKTINATESKDLPIDLSCVVVAFGSKCKGFGAYMARTFLVEGCKDSIKAAYSFVVEVHQHLLSQLKSGASVQSVYETTVAFAKEKNAALAGKLLDSFGGGTGLLLLDKGSSLNAKGTAMVTENQTYIVRVGLIDPEESFSVLIGDTVKIGSQKADLLTKAKIEIDNITILRQQVVKKAEVKSEEKVPEDYKLPATRAAAGTGGVVQLSLEELRRTQQEKIVREKVAEWKANGSKKGLAALKEELNVSELARLGRGESTSYDSSTPAPQKFLAAKPIVDVDRERETLWIPVGNRNVPFHIATISKIETKSEPGVNVLSVQFHTTQQSNAAFARHRTKQWIREVNVSSHDQGTKLFEVCGIIKEILAMQKARDTQRKQSSGVIRQEPIRLLANFQKLPQVKCRPAPDGGKKDQEGSLEAHQTGFRFVWRGTPTEIRYDNIEHCIVNPAKGDVAVILHFALKNPIMLGTKKHTHIQFYADVMEASEAVANIRKSYEQEIEDEEKIVERVKKTNQQFALFAHKVKTEIYKDLPVETAFSTVEFTGVPQKILTKMRANDRCLWAVVEPPFFSLSLRNVEVVCLERILPGQSTYDAAFVHKDYKTVNNITSIPFERLEMMKDWLNQAGIVYFESTVNVLWNTVLKTMRDDPEFEPWGPDGWLSWVDPDSTGEEGDDESDEATDSDWDESDEEESDDDSDDSDDSWAEEGESSDPDTGDSDESSMSSGKSWGELDRRAEEHDTKRRYSDDDDDDDKPKKKGHRTEGGASKKQAPPAKKKK